MNANDLRARREEDKALMKEAFKEVVQEKLAEFGWWSMKGIVMICASVLLYLYFTAHGWRLN